MLYILVSSANTLHVLSMRSMYICAMVLEQNLVHGVSVNISWIVGEKIVRVKFVNIIENLTSLNKFSS